MNSLRLEAIGHHTVPGEMDPRTHTEEHTIVRIHLTYAFLREATAVLGSRSLSRRLHDQVFFSCEL